MDTPLHPRLESWTQPPAAQADACVHQVRMEFPAFSENVGFGRTAVAMFASRLEFTLDELEELKIAVSEALSNCVLHAYPNQAGWIRVFMRIEDGELVVAVVDEGVGIHDLEKMREAGVTTRPEDCMGLGFTFMAEYTDHLEVESEPGRGTRVVMRKKPAAARSSPEVRSQPHEAVEGSREEARGDAAGG